MWGKGVSVMSVSATGSYGSDGSSSLAAAGVLMSSPEAAGVPSPPLVSSPEAVAQHNCASEQEHQAERSGSVHSPAQSQYSEKWCADVVARIEAIESTIQVMQRNDRLDFFLVW